jgi:hypothetical protein
MPASAKASLRGRRHITNIIEEEGTIMFRVTAIALTLALCAAPSVAQQPCSDLSVSGSGQPGTQLVFQVRGADPYSTVFLFLSGAEGTTSIPLGEAGTLTLGLRSPLQMLVIGTTNAAGNLTFRVDVPQDLSPQIAVFAQAVTATSQPNTPELRFCVSDVERFTAGA